MFKLETYFVDYRIYNLLEGQISQKLQIEYSITKFDFKKPKHFQVFDKLPFNDLPIKVLFIYSEYQDDLLIDRLYIRHFGILDGYTEYEYKIWELKNLETLRVSENFESQVLPILESYTQNYLIEKKIIFKDFIGILESINDEKLIKIRVDSHRVNNDIRLIGTITDDMNINRDYLSGKIFGDLDSQVLCCEYSVYQFMNLGDFDLEDFGFGYVYQNI